jgi:hypothetical protein
LSYFTRKALNRFRHGVISDGEKGALKMKASCRQQALSICLLLCLSACFSARANVYATDIRINGSLQAGAVVPGGSLTISYILNEPATAGVSLRISSSASVVKTFSSTNGGAGVNAGLNSVTWDGVCDNGSNAARGVYAVSITAAADGYDSWTNITDDGTNFEVVLPTGIAVNKNTNSPYYGRVFVGNGSDGEFMDGDFMTNGILKYNADGSPADEGRFSAGGYPWTPSGVNYANPSPWKMDVGADDRLYVEDWAQNGVVVSFDQVISSNYLCVLRPDNYPYTGISLSGPCVCGTGTNMEIFMADINPLNNSPPGVGILSWTIGAAGVVASNDLGTVEVTLTNNSDLTMSPYAVSVDTNGDIYTIQRLPTTNCTDDSVLCFPPVPSNGPPDTLATWEIGGGNPTLVNNSGVAADPTATFVAVASRGYGDPASEQDGGVSLFLAANGAWVTDISQDPAGNTNQEMIDVAWDAVTNLYALDRSDSVWRVYSPPGSNQATTVAVPFIQVYNSITPPKLGQPSLRQGQLKFMLTGQSNVTYFIEQSPDLINWAPVATNYSPNTNRTVRIAPPDTQDFYRAVAGP